MAKGQWISIDGLIEDTFENPLYLSQIPTERGEPGGGYTDNFYVWNFYRFSLTDTTVYFDKIEGQLFTITEVTDYLAGSSSSNMFTICEFELVDSNIAPSGGKCTLAIVGYESGGLVYFYLRRYVYDAQDVRTLHRDFGIIYNWNYSSTTFIKFIAGNFSRNGYDFVSIGLCIEETNRYGTPMQYDGRVMLITALNFPNVTGNGYPKTTSGDPNIDKDKTKPTNRIPVGDRKRGGDGSRDLTTSIISLPSLPPKTATSTGFVTLYSVTEAVLRLLADKLFTDTWTQALDNFFQNADEVIAGLSIVPFTPAKGGRAKPRVGLFTLDVAMDTIANQYKEIDCGEIYVDEYYGSAFDYSPYTKVSIFLPYIGIRSLDTDEVMGKTIGVKYYCDAYSGSCMACIYVKVNANDITESGNTPTVKYTFSGNCAQQVPTAAASWDRMIQSGIALACVALPAIASAGIAGAAGLGAMRNLQAQGVQTYAASRLGGEIAANGWAASGNAHMAMALDGATMSTAMSGKPTVERTGSLGSGVGFLGPQKPYLIRIIPRQSIPEEYMEFQGYPCNEYGTLGELEGYAQVEEIHLTEVYATGPEKDEIMTLLKGGVII